MAVVVRPRGSRTLQVSRAPLRSTFRSQHFFCVLFFLTVQRRGDGSGGVFAAGRKSARRTRNNVNDSGHDGGGAGPPRRMERESRCAVLRGATSSTPHLPHARASFSTFCNNRTHRESKRHMAAAREPPRHAPTCREGKAAPSRHGQVLQTLKYSVWRVLPDPARGWAPPSLI